MACAAERGKACRQETWREAQDEDSERSIGCPAAGTHPCMHAAIPHAYARQTMYIPLHIRAAQYVEVQSQKQILAAHAQTFHTFHMKSAQCHLIHLHLTSCICALMAKHSPCCTHYAAFSMQCILCCIPMWNRYVNALPCHMYHTK